MSTMVTTRTQLGLEAEEVAARHLSATGYRILDRNWRRPWGELDIVAERQGTIHFVEVKASSRQAEGFDPYLRANNAKMHKVRRTAQTWLTWNRYTAETEWQLDIISIIMDPSLPQPTIELFPQITF